MSVYRNHENNMWAMKSRLHLIQILTFALIFYVTLGFFLDFSEPHFTLVYKRILTTPYIENKWVRENK